MQCLIRRFLISRVLSAFLLTPLAKKTTLYRSLHACNIGRSLSAPRAEGWQKLHANRNPEQRNWSGLSERTAQEPLKNLVHSAISMDCIWTSLKSSATVCLGGCAPLCCLLFFYCDEFVYGYNDVIICRLLVLCMSVFKLPFLRQSCL